MRAVVVRLVLVTPTTTDLKAFETELRPLLERHSIDWVVVESVQVDQPRTPREIAEYEAGRSR